MMPEFSNRNDASAAAARYIAKSLQRHLQQRSGKVGLVVCGGTTPANCFAQLANIRLAWDRVQVTLTDERNVPVYSAESNERLVRDTLIQKLASGIEFVPLTAESQRGLEYPVACTLVGMGEDGHFASLFPDLADLQRYLDPDLPAELVTVNTSASPVERTSMTLAGLLDSDAVLVLAFGQKKRDILSAPSGYPVAALLEHGADKLNIFWAP